MREIAQTKKSPYFQKKKAKTTKNDKRKANTGLPRSFIPGTCRHSFPDCRQWQPPPGQSCAAWCVCGEDTPSYRAEGTAGRTTTRGAGPGTLAALGATDCSDLERRARTETANSWLTTAEAFSLTITLDSDNHVILNESINLPSATLHFFKAASTTSPGPGLHTRAKL